MVKSISVQKLDAKMFKKIQGSMIKRFENMTFSIYDFYAVLRQMASFQDVHDLNHLTKPESFCENIFFALFSAKQVGKDRYKNLQPKTYQDVLKASQTV